MEAEQTKKPAKKAPKKSGKKVAPARAIRSGEVSYDVTLLIREECAALADMLIEKNDAYGNSALEPVRIFSQASTEEQLLVRIDDKLSRLVRGSDAGEDVVQDLLGYLVLLRVARSMAPIPYAVTEGAR